MNHDEPEQPPCMCEQRRQDVETIEGSHLAVRSTDASSTDMDGAEEKSKESLTSEPSAGKTAIRDSRDDQPAKDICLA